MLAAFALAACQGVSRPAAPASVPDPQLVIMGGGAGGPNHACFRCHGLQGQGDGASPRLAGLPAGYLEKQLLDYAAERRPDKVMSPISRMLSEEERRAVARWYAALEPSGQVVSRQTAAIVGEQLYWRGAPGQGLPACSSCHGPPAVGQGAAFPPLAAQPAAYVAEQLHRWRRGERRNDPLGVMVAQARRLQPAQIEAIGAYLAALPAGAIAERPLGPPAAAPAWKATGPSG